MYQKIPNIPGNTRNTRKYPKVKKIPGNTRSYFSTLLLDPNSTRYPVFCPIPNPILKNPTRWALPRSTILHTHSMRHRPEAPGEGGWLKRLKSVSEQLNCFIKCGECEMKIVAKHKRRFCDRTIEKLRFWNFCVL